MQKRLRMVLTPSALAKEIAKGYPRDLVCVRKSLLSGKGVFSLYGALPGDVLCSFRGRILSAADASNISDTAMQKKVTQYMMCNDDLCAVPLNSKGQLATYETQDNGHLINEACHHPEGRYPANVYVDTDGGYRKDNDILWNVIAMRKIVPGEELLLCYGPFYEARDGYTVDAECG